MSNSKNFILGALVGSIAGAVTALLLTPKSGKELRSDLNEQVEVLKEKSVQYKDVAYTKGSELAAVAKEKSERNKLV